MAKPKIFVLDTNIPLHDYKSIRHFQDNDLVIPIAVIEELDKFKKGNDTLSFNARGFLRELDKITDGRLFGKDGVRTISRITGFSQRPSGYGTSILTASPPWSPRISTFG